MYNSIIANMTIRHAEDFIRAYVNAGLVPEGSFVRRYKIEGRPTRTELVKFSNDGMSRRSLIFDSPKDLIARVGIAYAGKIVYRLTNNSNINYKGR